MTVTAAQLAAETERMRDQFEADRLAAELGCEVVPNRRLTGIFDARDLAPGVWLLSGTSAELRTEWRAAWLREWLRQLGTLKPRRLLTPREQEVAVLVAAGLTDRQAAHRLTVSERTVHAHLRNIYAKTGYRNRAGLASWVTSHGGARSVERSV